VVVLALADADGRHTQTEEARVESAELRLDIREVEKILMDDFAQLRMADLDWTPRDRDHTLDTRIVETFEEHSAANHARRAEDDDVHERVGTKRVGPRVDGICHTSLQRSAEPGWM